MIQVKLLTIKEDLVSCESMDRLHIHNFPDSWTRTSDFNMLLTEEKVVDTVAVPIIKFCGGFDLGNESKTTYLAINYTNSKFFKIWLNMQTEDREKWKRKADHWEENSRRVSDLINNATFLKRLKYLFTGELND